MKQNGGYVYVSWIFSCQTRAGVKYFYKSVCWGRKFI